MQQIKYFHTYKTHVKQRWRNRHLVDVLESEFRTRSRKYYIGAIECGVITVNDQKTSPMYLLKDLDVIRHIVHIHEPIPPNIDIIEKESDYWVVNKPSGIPCHPTGGYFEYSVTRALFKDQSVGCVNRLDMPVSGVLILTFSNSNFAHNLLGSAEKVYIAKVKGEFPSSITVDKPVGLVSARMFDVSDSGKPSRTTFRLLEYRNGYSLVECRPVTGRTHQIRIHCKCIGFPILNDLLYGQESNTIKSEGMQPEFPELCNSEYNCDEDIRNTNDEKYKYAIRSCKGTSNRSFEISNSHICLHAWKYTFNGVTYEAPWPAWAVL
ncbi:RluA family pseudouridine synthase [Vittaforma corneae ATCC 50505]|uniref:RluA family pseudouridine synthase n=1 Tax=Vittaforma corneae (strain ATCC 50505) TaxID=993615 RepID=L2GQT7_VITCO|nr:RluA family pseudouridine synthase [Vittaforma corneae ATCC 50505]ELA42880.1 RluA family pseudouridine synthase [Vittaforma corneae ATCC 50505]